MDETIDRTLLVKRQLAFDILPHDELEEMLPELGLTGGDPEIFELEHADSHARLRQLEPIGSLLHVFSSLCAQMFNEAYLRPAVGEEITEEQREAFQRQNTAVIQSSATAVLAQLLDMKVLVFNRMIVVKLM